MTSSHAVYPVRKKPPSKKNFKENVPTYFRYTGGEFTMIQMDANTRKLGKETRDMGYSLHNNSALLCNASSRSFIIIIFCERLITLIF